MDSLNDDKINRQSSDTAEVESEEKQSGKEIEVDERSSSFPRAMAIHEHIREDGEKRWNAMRWLLWSAIAQDFLWGITHGEGFTCSEGVPGGFTGKSRLPPLVLSLSSWPASNYLLKIPLLPYCR